jgi:hypothetical protein
VSTSMDDIIAFIEKLIAKLTMPTWRRETLTATTCTSRSAASPSTASKLSRRNLDEISASALASARRGRERRKRAIPLISRCGKAAGTEPFGFESPRQGW